MGHYITQIHIEKLRHLENITINLNPDQRTHLLITGKNGSGKTTLLNAIKKYLNAINDGQLETEMLQRYRNGIDLSFANAEELDALYAEGKFITAAFDAERKTHTEKGNGVEDIKLEKVYDINAAPGKLLHKYMVHLKTQESYAKNEGDLETAERIGAWFRNFESALRELLDDKSLSIEYNYKEYDFLIHEDGREAFGLDGLSDGYSAVIDILSDLILRMDQNWLLGDDCASYDKEGIVLIDELETHLHIELQKKILPFLTTFFPRIQFIVSTHSPYILNSVEDAVAYDLENCVVLNQLTRYSADDLAEAYFNADEFSDRLKHQVKRYLELKNIEDATEEQRAERAKLRIELKNIPLELRTEVLGDL